MAKWRLSSCRIADPDRDVHVIIGVDAELLLLRLVRYNLGPGVIVVEDSERP